ncbi:transmembrane 220 family protein [Akkermansiaceae bacterium]|nr:transmembrane 220 family protein [Akkermansiaceae bacterium]
MKILNYFLAVLFLVFAWFQRNDIDPEIYNNASSLDSALWLLFYLVIGVVFILMNFKRVPKWYFIVALIACIIEMSLSGPGLWRNLMGEEAFTMTQTSMSAADPRVELTREFFGSVIALAAVAFQFWQSRKRKMSTS